METGIPGLDRMLGGGIPAGAAVLVEGGPGTGKSVLGMQFVHAGACRGLPGVYITFDVLPEQLYKEAASFGWDLRALEDSGLLRVVCTNPEAFLDLARTDPRWLEGWLPGDGGARLVIDSVTALLEAARSQPDHREVLRGLRGIMRRHRWTTLWIRDGVPAEEGPEHYVADGILRLGARVQGDAGCERTLTVVKMRGAPAVPQTGVMRVTSAGIAVVPPADLPSMASDGGAGARRPSNGGEANAEGVAAMPLDDLLSWALPAGGVLVLDVEARAQYRRLLEQILRHRADAGDDCFLVTLPDWAGMQDALRRYAELASWWREGRLYITGPPPGSRRLGGNPAFRRTRRAGCAPSKRALMIRMYRLLAREVRRGRRWFAWIDTNAAVGAWGMEDLASHLPAVLRVLRSLGVTTLLVADLRALGNRLASGITSLADGVIQMWTTVDYQYLQVVKSASGRTAGPYIVRMDADHPTVTLV
ncbi:ATPase domain-containing protein [Alicyclobacillus sp.]|uniref:ATPase domain-containing protein n=1 Tax=Alicyclobacillus sp. TaxID=61169 RepID=UPI0025B9D348|nr:ATPase domain-containing protein [Alicyclobacillus sp.]MCL6517967.1 hypothetical protein [Alicyclobacillus sp.]